MDHGAYRATEWRGHLAHGQPWERMPEPKHFQPREGRRQHKPDSAPAGLKTYWGGRVIPRLARRGLDDRARFAGFSGTLKVILTPIPPLIMRMCADASEHLACR